MMADEIINESEKVNYQLDSMRQFVDDLNALNALARERSNTEIIHQIHAENPQIREIQAENRQLKASIEEHQRAIELIMTKYRQHTQAQIEDTKLDFEKLLKVNNSNVSWQYIMIWCVFYFLTYPNILFSARTSSVSRLKSIRKRLA